MYQTMLLHNAPKKYVKLNNILGQTKSGNYSQTALPEKDAFDFLLIWRFE
jgi:hypothetical protein